MAGTDEIGKSVAVGSLAFGAVAFLTPRLFLGMYGVPNEPNVKTMTRLWGTRTAVLGALVLSLRGEDQRKLMAMAAAMNAADAVAVASSRGISWCARVLGSLTSAGFAAALGYALTD